MKGDTMDPTACLKELIRIFTTDTDGTERREAIELLEALTDWLDNGGFYPRIDEDVKR